MKKRIWSKPRLVILVRGKPAEAVLNGCKTTMKSDTPANAYYGCDITLECSPCDAWATS